MSAVCVIPARGGSKRIPRKNVKLFAGQPMIAHSIRAAREAEVFRRIIVSTDDDEIADVARQHGAEVPFMRPLAIATDFAGTDAVNVHAMTWLAEQGEAASEFCCIYATAPFLQAAYIGEGLKLLRLNEATSAISVTTFSANIFRALNIDERGRAVMFWPENFAKRSQDFATAYHDAAQFYWFDTAKYLAHPRMFTADAVPVVIPRHLVQDIDTPEDWEAAERMFAALWCRGITPQACN